MPPIFVSESPLRLLEQMAKDIASSTGPRVRHWLVLPGKGRSEWVQRRWADMAGIASHSQIVDLRSLVEQAATAGRPPFSLDRLVLAVAAALPALQANLPLPVNSDCSLVTAKVLAWSRQLADALDLGLLCRPATAQQAEDATFLRELAESPGVKKELAGHLGNMSTKAFEDSAKKWIDDWIEKGGIPKLWIHLDAGLPAVLIQHLTSLLNLLPDGQASIYMLSPSATFWGDLKVGRQGKKTWGDDAGPVLRPLGRQAQDLHNQAIEYFLTEGAGETLLESDEPSASLLGRLQQSCREAALPEEREAISPEDGSFTVHDCRSPLRELEVCRDRIIQALQADNSLDPKDILLLLADPQEMAPLVSAAFQPQADKAHRLPVRILGLGGAVKSPVAESLSLLLSAMNARIGLQEIQTLIENPLIAEKFGFDKMTEDGKDVIGWLKDAQFRWGLGETEREKAQGPGEHRWSLAFALRRLALGAIAGGTPCILDNSVPLDRARGLSTADLANFAMFAEQLEGFRERWAAGGAREVSDWSQQTQDLCETFLGNGDQSAREHRAMIISTLLPALEDAAPEGLKIAPDAWLRLMTEKFDTLSEGQATGGGGITVADLRQYAGTPFRMILVAGLGTESFPRREERPTWHPLAGSRKPGDPDRRDADRHSLLLALLSCQERLVLTYQGGSDEDDKLRPPSTPLADLLSAVDLVAKHSQHDESPDILFRHGLNGCSPQAFSKVVPLHGQSHLPSEYQGAILLQEPHQKPYPGLWSKTLEPEEKGDSVRNGIQLSPEGATSNSPGQASAPPWVLEKEEPCPEGAASPNILKSAPFPSVRILRLKDLVTLLEEPCRLFLTRLGLRLPEEEEELETGDFLKPGTLHNWSLQDQLLRALLENPDGIEALKERLSAAGDLPRGKYGDKTWEDAKKKTPKVENGPFAPLNHSFEIKITDSQGQDWLLKDTMPAGWYQKEGDPTADGTAFFFSASTLDRKRKLKLKLELLCLAVSGGAKKVTARFKDNKSESVVLSEKNTSELLKNLVDLYALARCLPLPFWPKAYDAMCTAKKAKSPASDAKCPTENQQPTAEELRKKACAECEESLRKAYAEWNPEYRGESSSPERDSAATRFAFRGLDDPFTWKPTLPDLPWLAEGGADKPLAWRLGRFINAWESKFNEQPTQETPSKPQDN